MVHPISCLKSGSNSAGSCIPNLCVGAIAYSTLIQVSHATQGEGIAWSISGVRFYEDCILQWIKVTNAIARCQCTGFRNADLWVVDDLDVISSIHGVGGGECLLGASCWDPVGIWTKWASCSLTWNGRSIIEFHVVCWFVVGAQVVYVSTLTQIHKFSSDADGIAGKSRILNVEDR